jgi:Fe-S oxidoreductase
MHAGDGNVHSNIPVHSDNYAMLKEADRMVDRIMALASAWAASSPASTASAHQDRLPGAEKLEAFAATSAGGPEQRFNPGKLPPDSGLDGAYTPSLRLVQQEAILLEETELGALNDDVKHCLRCGKCKPKCMTHVPRANLLYSPRNKILGTGLIIEAFLYEEQTRRGLSERHFDEMNDVADHCTICHKCLTPCPVNIDYGDVTMRMRRILVTAARSAPTPAPPPPCVSSTPRTRAPSALMRKGIGRVGLQGPEPGQRRRPRRSSSPRPDPPPGSSTGRPNPISQAVELVSRPSASSCPSAPTARPGAGGRSRDPAPARPRPATTPRRCSTSPAAAPSGCSPTSAWRPSPCSSTRRADRAAAGLPVLRLPQRAAGLEAAGQQITMDNRVLFHRVANTLNYLDIRTVIVSCGTCMDQLLQVRVRAHLPRLPAARHPRVPDGEGRQPRRRHRACSTSTTTPATRR